MNSVILVSVDSLRYDYIFGSNGGEIAPFLNDLKSNSLFFENAIATSSGTKPSFTGILSSSLPMDFGYRGVEAGHLYLPRYLKEEGDVSTYGSPNNSAKSSEFGFANGFDEFDYDLDPKALRIIKNIKNENNLAGNLFNWIKANLPKLYSEISGRDNSPGYKPANEVVDWILHMICKDEANQKFIWADFMETHTPYAPPKEYCDFGSELTDDEYKNKVKEINKLIKKAVGKRPPVHSNEEWETPIHSDFIHEIRQLYVAEIRYLDAELSRLYNGLQKKGVLDDTTILLLADHGEEFFDHGDFGHRPKFYDELINVPLLVHNKNKIEPRNVTQVTSLVDVPPTITDIFGMEVPNQWRGESLLKTRDEKYPFSVSELCHYKGWGGDIRPEDAVICIRTNNWKYILNMQTGDNELYDLVNDPGEKKNLYKQATSTDVCKVINIAERRLEEIKSNNSKMRNIL